MGKVSKYGVFSGLYFPVFGLNTERYSISLHIQSQCAKIRTRKNSVFGHFWRNVYFEFYLMFKLRLSFCLSGLILFASIRISYNVALFSLFKENMFFDQIMILDNKTVNTFSVISQNFFPWTRENLSHLSNEKFFVFN